MPSGALLYPDPSMLPIKLRAHEVNDTSVRKVERASIREFVTTCQPYLSGRVLDYGCGLQPYRDIVEAVGGEYEGFDRDSFPGSVGVNIGFDGEPMPLVLRESETFHSILCNQIVQYVPDPGELLTRFRGALAEGGHLILTYPTTWAEVETDDLARFTRAGMERLLRRAGFTIVRHEQRAVIDLGGFRLPLGYGVLARA